jgi:hypothetical protein
MDVNPRAACPERQVTARTRLRETPAGVAAKPPICRDRPLGLNAASAAA